MTRRSSRFPPGPGSIGTNQIHRTTMTQRHLTVNWFVWAVQSLPPDEGWGNSKEPRSFGSGLFLHIWPEVGGGEVSRPNWLWALCNLVERGFISGVLFVHDFPADTGEPDRSVRVAILRLVVLGKPRVTSTFGADAPGVKTLGRTGYTLDGRSSNCISHFVPLLVGGFLVSIC
jgi:hypothetical protein